MTIDPTTHDTEESEFTDCVGRCGRHPRRPRIACLWCWDLLPGELRQAIAKRRGTPRAELVQQAKDWYADNVNNGQLINPPAPQQFRFSLAQPGDLPPPVSDRPAAAQATQPAATTQRAGERA